MTLDMVARAFALWLAILVLAVANGALREAVLIPKLGSAPGLVLSGTLLSVLVLAVAYFAVPWLRAHGHELILIGLGWLAVTLVSEFSFGLLRGRPLGEILGAYAFKGGDIWPVVLLVVAAAPWLAGKLRGVA